MQQEEPWRPFDKLFDLSGKGAIVTGGTWGLGFGTARRLAEAGAGVLIADIQHEAAEKAVESLTSCGLKAWVQCDVASAPDVTSAMAITAS